jgi:hypothetical protein
MTTRWTWIHQTLYVHVTIGYAGIDNNKGKIEDLKDRVDHGIIISNILFTKHPSSYAS